MPMDMLINIFIGVIGNNRTLASQSFQKIKNGSTGFVRFG